MRKKRTPKSKISSYAHDPDTWLLEITLEDGRVFKYRDVPGYVYDLFVAARCKDTFLRDFIQAVGYRAIISEVKGNTGTTGTSN